MTYAPAAPGLCTLQWGRVVADAEGAIGANVSLPSTSFNGAASLPTRKAAVT